MALRTLRSNAEKEYILAIGACLRSERAKAGKSQEAVAAAAGIDRANLGEYERGERSCSPYKLRKLANAIGCSVRMLMPRM